MRGKFLKSFDEAKQWAKAKDHKLHFQANLVRREHQPLIDEQPPPPPPVMTNILEDPHLKLLQKVTAQLNDLSINRMQGSRVQYPPTMKRECKKHNLCKGLQQEDKSTLAGITGKTDMICIFALIQEDTLGMAKEEDLEGS